MPRWNEHADSQSIHLHVSLTDETGKSVFRDEKEKNDVSRTFRHFLGGLQNYIGDMALIFLPTVNCYRRFAPGTFAPPGLTWGFENRTTCFRIVGHDAGSLRVENRLPGADCNPYLSVAATIAAGVAGVIGEHRAGPRSDRYGLLAGTKPGFRAVDARSDRAFQRIGIRRRLAGRPFCRSLLRDAARPAQRVPPQEFPTWNSQRFFDLG